MLNFIKYLLKTALFWLLTFAFYRFIFILFNLSYSAGASAGVLAQSFWAGLRLDISMTSYILLLLAFLQAVKIPFTGKFTYQLQHWVNYGCIVIFTALLLGNINLYSYWGRLLDVEGLSFLKTPWVILASITWLEVLLFFTVWIILSVLAIFLYRRFIGHVICIQKFSPLASALATFLVLLLAGSMIIPIRGGFGVAPNNTGVAYFSQYNFANHAAINPLWNLFYSFKRIDARTHHYSFMDEDEALRIFNEMKSTESDSTLSVLNTERPNVVIVLLESFSAQVVGSLGGENITPNLDAVAKEGILFSNIYAVGDRSYKAIVGTMAGYQVLPTYSIIQYPEKSQSLSFMPQKLKNGGYKNLTYIYGGDIEFKGMNSFVTLSGFEKVVTIKDFPYSDRDTKWGVHDEHTFKRLVKEMKQSSSNEPYFTFYFTLSSHEPFDVPLKKYDDPYMNSIAYTDQCLGEFIEEVKKENLWDNTLFIFIADHGTPGPKKATAQMLEHYHIPMIWAGGALAVTDTIVTKLGSQKDMVATLLAQLKIDASDFQFSKDILSPYSNEYAFFTCYPDAFGYITPHSYQMYDNAARQYVMQLGEPTPLDSLRGKAYLQVLSADHLTK